MSRARRSSVRNFGPLGRLRFRRLKRRGFCGRPLCYETWRRRERFLARRYKGFLARRAARTKRIAGAQAEWECDAQTRIGDTGSECEGGAATEWDEEWDEEPQAANEWDEEPQ